MKKPIFFLHIPKTSGSSMNDFFKDRMRCEFHIEGKPSIRKSLRSDPGLEFVSGHMSFPAAMEILDRDDWFIFTMLRNPVEQLVSHLKWAKAIGKPERREEMLRYDERTQEVCARLHEIDLSDVDSIGDFIETNAQARLYFDNCHVRYMVGHRARQIGKEDLTLAMTNASKLDYVGLCDEAGRAADNVLNLSGRPTEGLPYPRSNRSPLKDMPNFSDPVVLSFYRNEVRFDAALYASIHSQH